MKGLASSTAMLALFAAPMPALAQDAEKTPPPVEAEAPPPAKGGDGEAETGDAPPPVAAEVPNDGRDIYTPADFARFAPRNALDMLGQVPGFSIRAEDQQRGLGQASANVLINGERLVSKSEGVINQLARISTNRVERIEIVDGATFGIPGLSGQVANVITKGGDISGRYEWRAIARPQYAKPSFFGGEVSISGTTNRLEWSAAYTHGTGRGGAGGGDGTLVTDGNGAPLEYRDVLIQFVGEFPRLSGRVKWDGPGSMVVNANASYSRSYTDSSNDEDRDLVNGIDLFRDFDNRGRGWGYEIGGDVDFALGPGRMKLIGLDRFNHNNGRSDSIFIYSNQAPSTGSRFTTLSDSGERIGRAEYRWEMLGANWQLDGEAAFNRLDQVSRLYTLDAGGDFVELPFPGGTGGVREDRYEAILNYNDTLARGLSLQVGVGGEYSKISQSGAGGLTREFWRPKGSATLAWTVESGLDLSLTAARTVGQLSFGDFLASVNLAQNTGNKGNVELVPQQAWEVDLEMKKNLQAWGSMTLRLYGRWIEDYIDIIPVNGGESRGNIESAKLLGVSSNATINLDPLGWRGAKVNFNAAVEKSDLLDPLTSISRPFSAHNNYRGEVSVRYDMPDTDWAMGAGFNWTHNEPYVRLFEIGREYEGPIYTFGFIEHKDVFGMTVNLNVFNPLGNGLSYFDRTVYTGLRDRTPIAFIESRRAEVSTIFRLQVKGSF